jgi:predicted methyltransferase
MTSKMLPVFGIFLVAILVGCGQPEPEAPAAAPESAAQPMPAPEPEMEMEATPLDLAALLADASRSDEDKARDAGRKPVEVLAFLGIEPGMDVIDLMAASGWYSEVLSLAVGPEGSVTAQNPPWMLAFRDGAYGTELSARIDGRLANVTRLDSTWEQLAQMDDRFDAALSALNLHDAYYLESPEAAAQFAAAVYAVLKPGGVFGVIDHVGNAESDNKPLHRIDKARAIEIMTGAGFVLEDESDMLANPDDDHTQSVFSEGIRGKTDRFLLKFRKPE